MIIFDPSSFAPQTLILGAMPLNADPKNTIASGPWCFAGQENLFPGWEKKFHFAPEPFAKNADLEEAVLAAQALCLKGIDPVSHLLSPYPERLPDLYWQILLMPWLINICSQIVERNIRCVEMVKKYGHLNLSVPVMGLRHEFKFKDEQDFTLRGNLGIDFNFWLFSRILEPIWPPAWKKIVVEDSGFSGEVSNINNGNEPLIKKFFRKFNLSLPFPKLKGMSLLQACKFSRALLHPCRQKDHSLNLKKFFSLIDGIKSDLSIDPLLIFKAALPESIKNLTHPASIKKIHKPHLRIASVNLYENANYRQNMAIWRASGNRLGFVQHGGNYGQIAVSCDRQLTEYSQDIFFTWGWKKQGNAKGNFVPLPYPQLQKIQNKWGNKNKKIIFTGTEMPVFGYRLESRPTPLQTVQYREDKAIFFSTLHSDLREITYYRPYFDLPGTLVDAPWILARFPSLKLCSGNLLEQIMECNLLILDHHGTTMLEAFVANIPTILYWQKEAWPLCPEAASLLVMLETAGIWHSSPEEAALKVNSIWPNTAEWWNSPPIQQARLQFCSQQANFIQGDENPLWISILKKQ